ncbi:MAG: hypothetical protein ABJH52_08945 [Henriciella sp.]
MTPQVRETEQTHIAGPRISPETAPINVAIIATPMASIKAPAPDASEEAGSNILDKRRRRRARMSNRH